MSQTVVTATLSLAAVFAAFGLVKVVLNQRADWNISATFLFSMGWLYVAPATFASFTGGKTRSFDFNGNPIDILSDRVLQLTHYCNYLLLAMSLAVVLVQAPRIRRLNSAALLAALLCAVSGLVAGLNAFPVFNNRSVTLLAALTATALLPAGRGACLGAAAFVVSLASLSGLLTLFHYSLATAPCVGLYKCGPLGVFIFGVVDNENGMSLSLAAGVVFVWLAVRARRWRNILYVYVLGMIIASGARTSAIAAALLFLALVLFGQRLDSSRQGTRRQLKLATAGLALMALAGTVVGAILPFTTNDPAAYTFRGEVWLIAREHLAGRYGIGNSQPGWSSLVDRQVIGQYAGYSVHNQWLDVVWISGVGGLILFLMVIAIMIRRDYVVGLIVLLPMILLGITERAWSIAQFDQMSFAYLTSLLAVPAVVKLGVMQGRSEPSEAPPLDFDKLSPMVAGFAGAASG